MCGFLGEFSFDSSKLTNRISFDCLLELSKNRGPDNTSVIQDNNYQLGFNRLAILDVSDSGNQPKLSPSKRYAVVFNGEIYNFKQLQKEYQLQNLQSSADTEVLIHLLDKLGIEKTIHLLNGMYAIAIVDRHDKTVTLVRDFAGIKPLYYGISDEGIVFASQFDQIFKHPWHDRTLELRPEIMKEYFGFGFMQAPNTVYSDIFQVCPGELIQFSEEGNLIKKVLIKFSCQVPKNINNKSDKNYNDVLKEIISDQLISDVSLASFLSGGIDSPLITAVAKQVKEDIEAFTFGIDNSKYDESLNAIEYAQHLKIKHSLEKVNENEILSNVEEHFSFLSEPFGDYSSVPTYLITKKAKKYHTVMLSGDGGDELFFGYPRMLDVLNKRHWFLIPFIIRKPLIKFLNKLSITKTWAPYLYKSLEEWIQAKQLHISPKDLDTFFANTSFSDEIAILFQLPKDMSKRELLFWLRWNEFYGHMQRILTKVDRMSMANSLEVRVPFLDKKSIDYAWNHVHLKLNNHDQLKLELKQSLKNYFPEELVQERKKGFSVPIEQWLRNELKENVMEFVFKKPFYGGEHINVNKVKAFVTDFYENKNNNGWGVWHIYSWQKWAYCHVSLS